MAPNTHIDGGEGREGGEDDTLIDEVIDRWYFNLDGRTGRQFASKVLRKNVVELIYDHDQIIATGIEIYESERGMYTSHPAMIDLRPLIRRNGNFLRVLNIREALDIALTYGIYAEGIIVTSPEHYLWMASVQTLSDLLRRVGMSSHVVHPEHDRRSVIKALLSIEGVVNSLDESISSRALEQQRDMTLSTEWISTIP